MLPKHLQCLLMLTLTVFWPPPIGIDRFVKCLPDGIKPETAVSAREVTTGKGDAGKRVTVKETLTKLKAHCRSGRLVDTKGRQIRFFSLIGCWGNPPEDYQEQLARQERELQQLRTKYTVVEISCSQSGNPKLIQ